MGILRYVAIMIATLYVFGVVGLMLEGQGIGAFIGSAFALVWVGWIVVLVGLPFFLVLRRALPYGYTRFAGRPRALVGAAVGFSVWTVSALALLGVAVAVSEYGPDNPAPGALSVLVAAVGIGAFGAVLGSVEAWFETKTVPKDILPV